MYAKATLLCRIGKKTYKNNKNNEPYSTLNVVTFKKGINREGQQIEYKDWHTVYCYSKLADIVEKYTNVGDLIFIEGDIRYRKTSDDSQENKWLYSIVATEIKLLPNKNHIQSSQEVQDNHTDEDLTPF